MAHNGLHAHAVPVHYSQCCRFLRFLPLIVPPTAFEMLHSHASRTSGTDGPSMRPRCASTRNGLSCTRLHSTVPASVGKKVCRFASCDQFPPFKTSDQVLLSPQTPAQWKLPYQCRLVRLFERPYDQSHSDLNTHSLRYCKLQPGCWSGHRKEACGSPAGGTGGVLQLHVIDSTASSGCQYMTTG